MTRQSFSPAIKPEAVRLLENGDNDGAQLAIELGLRSNMLYKWQAEINLRGTDAFQAQVGDQKNRVTLVSLKQ